MIVLPIILANTIGTIVVVVNTLDFFLWPFNRLSRKQLCGFFLGIITGVLILVTSYAFEK